MAAASRVHPRPGGLRGLLLPDHNDRLELLLEEVMLEWQSPETLDGPPVWQRFVDELRVHLVTVERWLLPPFAIAHPAEASGLHAEHQELLGLVAQVERERELKARPVPGLSALGRHLRAHARREDRLLYPWAVENLEGPPWKEVRARMRAIMFHGSSDQKAGES